MKIRKVLDEETYKRDINIDNIINIESKVYYMKLKK